MTSRRRKTTARRGKRGQAAPVRTRPEAAAQLSGRTALGVAARPAAPAGAARGRSYRAPSPEVESGAFLAPEQQHLLRIRRAVERREVWQRRLLIAAVLVLVAVAAAAIAWSVGVV